MLLTRSDFVASLNALRASTDSEERAIGENFSFEENVSDVRRDDEESDEDRLNYWLATQGDPLLDDPPLRWHFSTLENICRSICSERH